MSEFYCSNKTTTALLQFHSIFSKRLVFFALRIVDNMRPMQVGNEINFTNRLVNQSLSAKLRK